VAKISRMIHALRIFAVPAVALFALTPVVASAATPTPSPSVEQVLASPPAGFTEVTSAAIHGHFTARDYASNAEASKQSSVENTLNHEGFVDGYGKTWVHNAAQHVLVEEVFAFTGARGARNWLNAAEVGDKANATYQHADSLTGIDPYYGEHLYYSASKLYGDAYAFAKGNDVLVVAVVSTKDDALAEATTQTRSQYSSAPDQTIPSSDWPENKVGGASAVDAGKIGGAVAVALLLAGLVGFVLLRRRRSASPMPMPVAAAVQLSPDGNFWWDGQAWRDAAHDFPPSAQRSADGAFWWDGRTWRPITPVAPSTTV
jgi:hypothetical protein